MNLDFWYAIGNAWPDAWIDSLVRACWQGGLLLLAVWAVGRLFPRLSAEVYHWLWWLACLKLLVTLAWIAPIPPAPPKAVSLRFVDTPLPYTYRPLALLALFWAFWLLGAAWNLGRAAWQFRWLQRALHGAEPLTHPAWIEAAQSLARAASLHRPPRLLVSERVKAPLIAGYVRPAILFPARFPEAFSLEEGRMVIAHELAHLRRRDLWLAGIPMLAQTLFCFFPLVWRACREWIVTREAACDADALRLTGGSPADYGQMLLRITLCGVDGRTFGALGMTSGYHTLKTRLTRLQEFSARNTQRRRVRIAFAALCLLLILPWQARTWGSTPEPKVTMRHRDRSIQSSPSCPYVVTDLSLRVRGFQYAFGINNAGQVAGILSVSNPRGTSSLENHTCLWDARSGLRVLGIYRPEGNFKPDLGGWETTVAVTSATVRGQTFRMEQTANGEWRVYVVRQGVRQRLDLRLPGGTQSRIAAMNRRGQIVGQADTDTRGGRVLHAFLYSSGKIADLGTFGNPEREVQANAINDRGEIVGHIMQGNPSRAFLYRDGKMSDLNSLLPADFEITLTDATDINDAGQIIASGTDYSHGTAAFLLTPR